MFGIFRLRIKKMVGDGFRWLEMVEIVADRCMVNDGF
jgi:hypothetical protein